MTCSCGYKDKEASGELSEKSEKEKTTVDIAEEKDDHLPITNEAECPECGHGQAHYWTVQTRAGDEPETKFLKCPECKHVWRDYA